MCVMCCAQHVAASKELFSDEDKCGGLLKQHRDALQRYKEHVAKDYWTRGYINCMKRLATALDRVYTDALAAHCGELSVDEREKFGEYMLFVHMDDRSDKDVPSTPVQTETVEYANPCHIHGQHDHADNTADIYVMEPGGGSKTTSCVKDEWCALISRYV